MDDGPEEDDQFFFEPAPVMVSDDEADSDFEAPEMEPDAEDEVQNEEVKGDEVKGDEVKTGEAVEVSPKEDIPDKLMEDTGAAVVEHEEDEEFTAEDKKIDFQPEAPKRLKVQNFDGGDFALEMDLQGKIKALQDRLKMLQPHDLDFWKCFILVVGVDCQ